MFMTQDELKELTGYKLHAWQRRWLDSHRWKYERAANGCPVVLRAYAESKLSEKPQKREAVLNLDCIRVRA